MNRTCPKPNLSCQGNLISLRYYFWSRYLLISIPMSTCIICHIRNIFLNNKPRFTTKMQILGKKLVIVMPNANKHATIIQLTNYCIFENKMLDNPFQCTWSVNKSHIWITRLPHTCVKTCQDIKRLLSFITRPVSLQKRYQSDRSDIPKV